MLAHVDATPLDDGHGGSSESSQLLPCAAPPLSSLWGQGLLVLLMALTHWRRSQVCKKTWSGMAAVPGISFTQRSGLERLRKWQAVLWELQLQTCLDGLRLLQWGNL